MKVQVLKKKHGLRIGTKNEKARSVLAMMACPDCGCKLVAASGCAYCPCCGWSLCS